MCSPEPHPDPLFREGREQELGANVAVRIQESSRCPSSSELAVARSPGNSPEPLKYSGNPRRHTWDATSILNRSTCRHALLEVESKRRATERARAPMHNRRVVIAISAYNVQCDDKHRRRSDETTSRRADR